MTRARARAPVDIAAERELDRARSLRFTETYGCAGKAIVWALGLAAGIGLLVALFLASIEPLTFDFDAGPLGPLPIDPGDGKGSARLAVQVAPSTGLAEGTEVTVTSRAFQPRSVVGVAVCLQETKASRKGDEACDMTSARGFATDAAGELAQPFTVPRVITVAGRAHDCASQPGRCSLRAASARSSDQSGGQPLSFARDLPTPDLTPKTKRPVSDRLPISATPPGPYLGSSEVEVTASGFRPGEPLIVVTCTDELDTRDSDDICEEPKDQPEALTFTRYLLLPEDGQRADSRGQVKLDAVARAFIRPLADDRSSADDVEERRANDIDCTERANRCAIVVAAAADTRRSAVLPYTVSDP